jgi:hypothetical protein
MREIYCFPDAWLKSFPMKISATYTKETDMVKNAIPNLTFCTTF